MRDELMVAARTSAAAIVYERSNFRTRKGSSAGSAPCARSVARWPEDRTAIAFLSSPAIEAEDIGGSLPERVAGDQRVGKLPLCSHDLAAVALQLELVPAHMQMLPLT